MVNFEEIEKAIVEIQQPRSEFQLQKFVVNQHPTEEMRFYQTCLELQDMIYKYKTAKIDIERQQIKISRLRKSGDELDELKAQKIELGMDQTKLAMIGAEREMIGLAKIFDSFSKKYTREEIEAAQADYWEKRLSAGAQNMLMSSGSISSAQIEAMQQAGIFEKALEQQANKEEIPK